MSTVTALIISSLLISLSPQAPAPLSPEGFISSRQGELTRYGKLLFHVDFDDGHWTHRTLQACPSFTHHALALYERTSASGTDRYLVTYNLNTSPAKASDRPWQGGIVAAPLGAEWGTSSGTRPDEAGLLALFNHVVADERQPSQATDGWGSQELAVCFAVFAGEEPSLALETGAQPGTETPSPISSFIFQVKSTDPLKRYQSVLFDKRGLVEKAEVEVERLDTQ